MRIRIVRIDRNQIFERERAEERFIEAIQKQKLRERELDAQEEDE